MYCFYHWRNRNFYINKRNSSSITNLLSLVYYSSTKELRLVVNKLVSSFTMPSSLDGEKIVIWLTEKF